MLNSDYKNEAKNRYEKKVENFEEAKKESVKESEILFTRREKTVVVLQDVINYVNRIRSTPVELQDNIIKVENNVNQYVQVVNKLKKELDGIDLDAVIAGTATAGAIGGVAAAVSGFGPSAAMAIATTFGTASTGTAISALSGAAATQAALAWLGGGALVAGGGGTAAGGALLTMLAGPVGWTIGGIGLLLGGAKMASKNKEIAEKYNKAAVEVDKQLKNMKAQISSVQLLRKGIVADKNTLVIGLKPANLPTTFNYLEMTVEEKEKLGQLVNVAMAAATKLNKRIEVKQG